MSSLDRLTRRDALRLGALAGTGLALQQPLLAAAAQTAPQPLITKPIPSSGEKIPVIGLGTNAYGVTSPEDLAARKAVLQKMPDLGGTVVDTAPGYGRSEEVIGNLVAEIGNRNKLFFATKVTAPNGDLAAGKGQLDASFSRLKTDRIELIAVHNLSGTDVIMPVLLEMKAAKKIKYVGVTTSNDGQHGALAGLMKKYPLDFIQVNYSLGDRESAQEILPLAQDRGAAVMLNIPFGGRRGSLFSRVTDRPLPDFAKDFGVETWGQFFLKYAVAHPAVTCAIPGTTKVAHLEDNQRAGRGTLPDAAMRKRIEQFWDGLT